MDGDAVKASIVCGILPAGDDEECGEEEDEDSSSSSPNLEDQLSQFRQEWRKELTGTKPRSRRSSEMSSEECSPTEEKARYLFMQGVEAERNGQMYEAIRYYRQAVQLVPDIEQMVEDYRVSGDLDSDTISDSENEFDNDDKVFQQLTSQLGALSIHDITSVCEKEFPQQATHISALPIELIHYILRWVVSTDLDMRSLEVVSEVCRGFYVCARDPELWRLSCFRIWGKTAFLTKDYPTWRQLYLERPHVLYNGVYICRTAYVRPGDETLNPFYHGWILVEYYRFVRVFPDGVIMMLTSPDDPQSVVARLKTRDVSIPGLLVGQYRIIGNVLTAVMEKDKKSEKIYESVKNNNFTRYRNRNRNQPNEREVTYHVELELGGTGRKQNTKLTWRLYNIHTRYKPSNVITVSDVGINTLDPMIFSRVKSYTRYAEEPL